MRRQQCTDAAKRDRPATLGDWFGGPTESDRTDLRGTDAGAL